MRFPALFLKFSFISLCLIALFIGFSAWLSIPPEITKTENASSPAIPKTSFVIPGKKKLTDPAADLKANEKWAREYTEFRAEAMEMSNGPGVEREPFLPPPGFDKWLRYAESNKCLLDIKNYAQIYRDLEPFLSSPSAFQNLASVKHVQVGKFGPQPTQKRDTGLWDRVLGRLHRRRDEVGAEWKFSLGSFEILDPIAHILPHAPFEFAISHFDEPQMLPAEESKMEYSNWEDIFAASQCVRDKFDTPSLENRLDENTLRESHGFLMAPDTFVVQNKKAPLLTQSKTECFMDIMIPGKYAIDSTNAIKDTVAWKDKASVLFWRGASTSGRYAHSNPWQKFHRTRLLDWEKKFRSKYPKNVFDAGKDKPPTASHNNLTDVSLSWLSVDIGLSNLVQTDPDVSEQLQQLYSFKSFVSFESTLQFKYLLVIDVILLATAFTDWYMSNLIPFVHFVPVKMDLSDLEDQLRWLRANDAKAQQISANARKLMKGWNRMEQLSCYSGLLMLEYGRMSREANAMEAVRPGIKPKVVAAEAGVPAAIFALHLKPTASLKLTLISLCLFILFIASTAWLSIPPDITSTENDSPPAIPKTSPVIPANEKQADPNTHLHADLNVNEKWAREYTAFRADAMEMSNGPGVEMEPFLPPPGFDKWLRYAESNKCLLDIKNYAQIYRDLDPFLSSPSAFQNLASVKNVQVGTFGPQPIQKRDTGLWDRVLGGFISTRRRRDDEMVDWKFSLGPFEILDPIAHILPHAPFEFAISHFDEPQMLPAEEANVEYSNWEDIFAASQCMRDKFDTPSRENRLDENTLRESHGFLMAPDTFVAQNKKVPLLTQSKTECFMDIIIPGKYAIDSTKAIKDTVAWRDKADVLFWRGSSTSGRYAHRNPWQKFHRTRLLDWEKKFRSKYPNNVFDAGKDKPPTALHNNPTDVSLSWLSVDIGLSLLVQTDPDLSHQLEQLYPFKSFVSFESTMQFKYLLVIDDSGNTWPSRLQSYLTTNSVILLATAFTDWYMSNLIPFVHFVPVKMDLSDLEDQLRWLRANDAKAQQISANARKLMSRWNRMEQMSCYSGLLMLEYGRMSREANAVEAVGPEIKPAVVAGAEAGDNNIDD
ncbi:F-actin-capping protein subunit alpha [Podochytrium sp. JEL0797]|nr:F-actin-capping protein subunit alpha [Podochytrium sp. JEL0797]